MLRWIPEEKPTGVEPAYDDFLMQLVAEELARRREITIRWLASFDVDTTDWIRPMRLEAHIGYAQAIYPYEVHPG